MIILKEFQRRFKVKNLLITLTFETNAEIMDDQFEKNDLFKYIDYIQISDMKIISRLIKSGVLLEKVIFHIFLQGYERLSNDKISFYVENIKDYNEICQTLSKDVWKRSYDGSNCIAEKNYENQHLNWIIKYDCSRLIANKIRQAMKQNLAGILISYLSSDNFAGKCRIESDTFDDFNSDAGVTLQLPIRNVTTFSALHTINEAIGVTLDEINQMNKIS